jgi:hypothetical protein
MTNSKKQKHSLAQKALTAAGIGATAGALFLGRKKLKGSVKVTPLGKPPLLTSDPFSGRKVPSREELDKQADKMIHAMREGYFNTDPTKRFIHSSFSNNSQDDTRVMYAGAHIIHANYADILKRHPRSEHARNMVEVHRRIIEEANKYLEPKSQY